MTNVLSGANSNVFAASSAFARVAFGCFAGNGCEVWNSACAEGQLINQYRNRMEGDYPCGLSRILRILTQDRSIRRHRRHNSIPTKHSGRN